MINDGQKVELQIAVAKINKYASSESGDTVEMIERPRGGISVVIADGQRSGRSAKAISNIVVRKAIALLAEGVRDGAVARATHDYLHAQRGGKVSAEFSIVSIDMVSRSMVISRNSRCPMLVRDASGIRWLDEPSEAIGIHRHTKPAITELPLNPDTTLIVVTDGVWGAGSKMGSMIDLPGLLESVDCNQTQCAMLLADALLAEAMRLDQGRPRDDASVLVIKLVPFTSTDKIRRLELKVPL